MDYPKTRKEAMAQGAKFYFTGEPCKHGHIALRKAKGACVECVKEEQKRNYEKRMEYFKEYNESERGKEVKRRHYEKNKEAIIQKAAARPDEVKRQYRKNWKEKNKDQVRADTKVRRKKHQQATPPWISREDKTRMRELYQTAIKITRDTGMQYEVDHIIPLRNPVVCGLHVPWNLQILRHDENRQKSNFHDNTVWIIYTPENPWRSPNAPQNRKIEESDR